ncbi:hypothetical protein Bca52824_029090 [Brassica carinata]|uniref:F-box associated beta-propeller type 1 domain-containing protein n=1 Tax=Brassica carinata TaxID=52824 RepID=A0A8X8ASH8_BRACI|nr:hypothetical protein Bca52824_029090 [Brassica carinata]
MMDFKVCSARINLNGILKDEEGSGPISIKLTDRLNEIEISKVFCCYALLLCANKDNTRLLVWNPYLGQTKWIEPKKAYHRLDRGLDVTPDWDNKFFRPGLTVKGNTYFFAKQKIIFSDRDVDDFLVSFNFTKERFGPRLHVPFHAYLQEDRKMMWLYRVSRREACSFISV